jgi:hypothetical protein
MAYDSILISVLNAANLSEIFLQIAVGLITAGLLNLFDPLAFKVSVIVIYLNGFIIPFDQLKVSSILE